MNVQKQIILVLDTSVIVSDDRLLDTLDDFDLAVPARVLEELDPFKHGNEQVNHAARHFIREADIISEENTLENWNKLRKGKGRLKIITDEQDSDATEAFEEGSADNYIIDASLLTAKQEPNALIILITNDINLRLKARALGIYAIGYKRDAVLQDIEDIRKASEQA